MNRVPPGYHGRLLSNLTTGQPLPGSDLRVDTLRTDAATPIRHDQR